MRGRRLLYAPLALALLGFAISEVVVEDTGLWQLLVFAVLPDLALFLGIGGGLARGQLHPRAVPLYNALHHPAGPLLAVIVAAALLPDAWLAAALAWGAHVAMDRAAGYGLRTREGFQRWPAAA